MDRQPAGRDLVQHRIQHGGHRARGADAYGVAEGYLVAAQIQQSLSHGGDPLGPGRAVERAGDDGGEVAAHLDAEAACLLHQGGEAHQRLLHADADVGPGKAVRAGGEEAYLVGAGGDGGLQPLQIGHQGAVTGCNLARQGVEQCGGVRHLRHLFGGDEGAHLDALQPALGQPGDELQPLHQREGRSFILQAVPRPHLH